MNRTSAGKIVAAAIADGTIDTIAYYVSMRLPTYLRPRPDVVQMPANYLGFVPVVPLSMGEKEAWETVSWLWEILKASNEGREILFSVDISAFDIIAKSGLRCYVWGDEDPSAFAVDKVCPVCAGVVRTQAGDDKFCCMGKRPRRKRVTPVAVEHELPWDAMRVGLNWYGGT